jgi:hypothetical protein
MADMSELNLIEKLAAAVATQMRQQIPIDVALWDVTMCATYFQRDPKVFRQTIACLPSFPKAIRLPTERRAHPLYNAWEVIEWAQKYKEKN